MNELICCCSATSEEHLQAKMKKAYSIVAGAAAGGGVSGALPVPGADIAATIGKIPPQKNHINNS